MIAYYPFEGDFRDALGDVQKDFIAQNEPNFLPGYSGFAAYFDGIDDTAVTLSFVENDFSIAFWINTTDSYTHLYDKFWDGKGLVNAGETECVNQGDWGICLQDGDKAAFGIGAVCEDETAIRSQTPINDGQWHFICCTRDGTTGEYRIYVDDGWAEDADVYTPAVAREPLPMYLASVQGKEGYFLNGRLDELVFFDHVLSQLEIDYLREHGVYLPQKAELLAPADGAVHIAYQTNLRWSHPDIIDRYRVYLDTNPEIVNEPNLPNQPMLLEGIEILPASETDPNGMLLFNPVAVDTEYFWRVDSRVIEPNWSYINPDTNEPYWNSYTWVKGDVWSFQGIPETVLFTGSEDRYILPDPVTHAMPISPFVEFSVQVLAGRPIVQFEWMKNGVPIWIDEIKYSAETEAGLVEISSTLTIHDAGEAEEGAYSFRIELDTMEEYILSAGSLYVSSEIIVHRYSFSGSAEDSIGDANGIIVDPNVPNIIFENDALVFAGFDGDNTNNISGDPNAHFVDLPNGLISSLGNNMTLMVWFASEHLAGPPGQRVFDFGINGEGLEGQSALGGGNYLMLTPRHESGPSAKMRFESRFSGAVQFLHTQPPPLNQEVCAAVTWSSEENLMRMYVNGQMADEKPLNGKLSNLDDRNNWLGRSQWLYDPLFIGRIDELRIYNVPLSESWIEAFYQDGPNGDPLNADPCLFKNPADLNGDCIVDLADFAVFAENWVWCGLLSCQD